MSASALEISTKTDLPNAKIAAGILAEELKNIPGADRAIIVLQHDPALKNSDFTIDGNGKKVTISAGKYAFIHAAGYYMDKICNIIRFSHFERDTDNAAVNMKFPPVKHSPAFELRDIFFTTPMDKGRFAALRGLNAHGDWTTEFAKNNGHYSPYGGPKFCHTFHLYFPAEKYFDAHPEWFSEINGKRYKGHDRSKTQLCLSNKELRKAFIEKLQKTIEADRKRAAENGMEAPYVYDVSQNDFKNYCTCKECNALVKKYGNTQSGPMLEFVNEIAAGVTAKYPDIRITTFAYQYTEIPPTGIKPHPNVIIVLCDTISNVIKPISDPANTLMANKIRAWSNLAAKLRIWDYDVTYLQPNEMPFNNEDVFQKDLQFFRDNKVSQYFVEFEYPITSDVRDYKLYLLSELVSNPDADVEALKKRFAQAYFGKAADLFLAYRNLLKTSQIKNNSLLDWFPGASLYTHLDYPTVKAAHALFDAGYVLLANDPVRLRRWNFARLSLDRATLILAKKLKKEYFELNGSSIDGYPFNTQDIKKRISSVIDTELADREQPKKHKEIKNQIAEELAKYNGNVHVKALSLPERFKKFPAKDVYDFTLEGARIWKKSGTFIDDPDSSTGCAIKVVVPNPDATLEHHKLPTSFGVYSRSERRNLASRSLRLQDIKPGYNWYKVCTTKLVPGVLTFFCFKSWCIQEDVSNCMAINDEDRVYDFFLRIKFTGKLYGGSEKDQDAIYVDRLVVVRKENK